jgi:hypothetical protein
MQNETKNWKPSSKTTNTSRVLLVFLAPSCLNQIKLKTWRLGALVRCFEAFFSIDILFKARQLQIAESRKALAITQLPQQFQVIVIYIV